MALASLFLYCGERFAVYLVCLPPLTHIPHREPLKVLKEPKVLQEREWAGVMLKLNRLLGWLEEAATAQNLRSYYVI